MSVQHAQDSIKLMTTAHAEVLTEAVPYEDLFSFAQERNLLPALHASFLGIAPKNSKLKEQYHWRNLQASLNEHRENKAVTSALVDRFFDLYFNFARRFVLIDQLDATALEKALGTLKAAEPVTFIADRAALMFDDSPDASELPLEPVHFQRREGTYTFVVREVVAHLAYAEPPLEFLSETGRPFRNQIRLKKRTAVPGFHKVIIDEKTKLRIVMIDASSLLSNVTPADKRLDVLNAIVGYFNGETLNEGSRRVTFFQAIKPLYLDPQVGWVTGGAFYTSSGAKYFNFSKGTGTDLRKDPFQMGGQKEDLTSMNFIKLELSWPNLPAKPQVKLSGSAEMFNAPEKSMSAIQVAFCTEQNKEAEFLQQVLPYAYWD